MPGKCYMYVLYVSSVYYFKCRKTKHGNYFLTSFSDACSLNLINYHKLNSGKIQFTVPTAQLKVLTGTCIWINKLIHLWPLCLISCLCILTKNFLPWLCLWLHQPV